MKVFFAHSKGTENVDGAVVQLQKMLKVFVDCKVIAGKTDYKARFATCGTWDAWTRSVATGKVMGAARYDAIVVPDRVVGRATAQIIQHALSGGKSVLFWDPKIAPIDGAKPLWRVLGIEVVDGENWKAGWKVMTAKPRPPENAVAVAWDWLVEQGWRPMQSAPVGSRGDWLSKGAVEQLASEPRTTWGDVMSRREVSKGFIPGVATLWRPSGEETAASRATDRGSVQDFAEFLSNCDVVLRDCRTLLGNPHADDFALSIMDKVEGMRQWAEENSRVTAKMERALENMHHGALRWLE